MKKLPKKMSTEALSEHLGVTKQTINRWIREQHWHTELMPGVKGGRARLIVITDDVLDYLANMPAMQRDFTASQLHEPNASYTVKTAEEVWQQITDVLQNMTLDEQRHLHHLLTREGICGFLSRLGLQNNK